MILLIIKSILFYFILSLSLYISYYSLYIILHYNNLYKYINIFKFNIFFVKKQLININNINK
jgi:hypothetical protein